MRRIEVPEFPLATPIAASEGTCTVRCPHCDGVHDHEIFAADDSLVRRAACAPRLLYRIGVTAPARVERDRHPRPRLPSDHPLSRARAAGIRGKQIAARLGWPAERIWARHTRSELDRIDAVVDELIAEKEEW